MYLRLSIQGNLPGGEVWSVNPAYHFNAAFSPTWDQASGDAICNALPLAITATTLGDSLRSLLGPNASITGYRLEGRDEDERLLGVSQDLYTNPLTGAGTSTKTNTAATVISLRSNMPGASGRGRLYWPALGASLAAPTGRLTSPTTAAIRTDASALLELIGDTIKANAGVFPFTEVLLGVRSVADHQTRTVTRIQVGDILDTQRRRRDSMVENYSTGKYPL